MPAEPPNVHDMLAMAVSHHQQGRLAEAERLYRQVLAIDPDQSAAWHLLGVVHWQGGQFQAAAEFLKRAIRLNGAVAAFHANLGNAYQGLGRLDDAASCYRRAVVLQPELAAVHVALGNVLLAQRKPAEAEHSFRKALELKPSYADAHCNLSSALQQLGRLDEAAACCLQAIALRPDQAEAHASLGGVRYLQKRWDDAAESFRRALELKPELAQVHNNLALLDQELGRLDDAAAGLRRASELAPNWAEPHANLALVLQQQGYIDEAIASYHRALALAPDRAATHCNLGTALQEQDELDEAIACYGRAIELEPRLALAHFNLGKALGSDGRSLEAIEQFQRAASLQGDFLAALGSLVHEMSHACQWDGIEPLARRVVELVDRDEAPPGGEPLSPFALLALPIATTAQQQLRCARQWADEHVRPSIDLARIQPRRQTSSGGRKITLGYLSADFNDHAIAVLSAELFEKHDRQRFQVYGYSYGRDDKSLMRARLEAGFDRFVDIRPLSHVDAARRIAADGVDILVDITGYTKNARSRILAARPAPIQVNFLSYVGTMGTPLVDYIMVDEFVVPAAMQPYYVEKLVHLPGCYMVNDSRRAISSQTQSRSECGLPEDGFVFCSFNNNYKITPAMFSAWMRLLAAVPGSVLWLLEGNGYAPASLRREAAARGIAPERLIFAPRCPPADHLARHRLANLFLDTYPYNSHTTASDCLWAGCPLVTLAGDTFQSRVAGSLLTALGLSELITSQLNEYEATALRLATNPAELAEWRIRLAASRSSSDVFDAAPFARKLEAAYTLMWERQQAGQPPAAFRVTAEQ